MISRNVRAEFIKKDADRMMNKTFVWSVKCCSQRQSSARS